MELVEREAPLALLTALAAKARGGHGRAVLVSGPVAAGKSVLVHNVADRAPGLGMFPLTALGSEDERHLPLGVVRQLVDDAPLDPADLSSLDHRVGVSLDDLVLSAFPAEVTGVQAG
ncbi:AAA family ATPase, partial [Streptomyces sp. NPDC058757]|uniref:AAA family ATPase n=1 Tax=Streptomyces sp. NPDC058757 TaxID=3346626 RepID=UPI0036BBB498